MTLPAAGVDLPKDENDALERTQQELVNRSRLAALGQLAATLAHEVRNPLGVLFNSIGTLAKLFPPNGDASVLLAIMREEAGRLERLVRELLDFARPLAPSFESEPLGPLVSSAVDAATRDVGAGQARIAIEVGDDLPAVRVDASMMRRALVNLVVNGVQAAGASGAVVVRASQERRGGRRYARVEVHDDGGGIALEIAGRIFDPFFTAKATGTGLGLAVVKSIVESHAGTIAFDSTPGEGTTMTVSIPIDAA